MAHERISQTAAADAQADAYIKATEWIPQFPMGGIVRCLGLAIEHIERGRDYLDFADLTLTGGRQRKVRQETARIHGGLGVANVVDLDARNDAAWEMIRAGASWGEYLLANEDNSTIPAISPLVPRCVRGAAVFLATEDGRGITKELLEAAQEALAHNQVVSALDRFKRNTTSISKHFAEMYPNDRERNSGDIRDRKTGEMNAERRAFMAVAAPKVVQAIIRAGGSRRGVEGFAGAVVAKPSDAIFKKYGLRP